MNYKALHIFTKVPEKRDFWVGWLSTKGFSGFEETNEEIVAFIDEETFSMQDGLIDRLSEQQLHFSIETIADANWNAIWENSFSPVHIGQFCAIRAAFHEPVSNTEHEIVITPRMAFGTGHHSTTASMIRLIETLDLKGKTLLDFGTGTGILAILASKMGASEVWAVDNDPNATDSACQNALENQVKHIKFACADKPAITWGPFDTILVNIHLQIILSHLTALLTVLNPGGNMLWSGILKNDYPVLEKALAEKGCLKERLLEENGWLAGWWRKP